MDASAGSGKTYALAHRYIQLLLQKEASPDAIRTILAITFTNMAAREMKERVLEFLKKIALDFFTDPGERDMIFSKIELDKPFAQIRAQKILDYIIHNYNFFQIQTIDSFVYLLLSGCAFRLGLPANFKLQENYQQLLLYSVDECIEKAARNVELREIIQEFLRQYVYIENKENWFPKRDILRLLQSLFSQMNVYGKDFAKSDWNVSQILERKRAIKNRVREFIQRYSQFLNGTFLNSLKNFCDQEEVFDLIILTGKNFTKKTFLYDSPPLKKYATPDPELEEEWLKIREEITEIAEAEARTVFNCYINIFELVYRIFESRAQKEELMFLQELNRKAQGLFGRDFQVPEIYYRLAIRFRHFLIDEFQDTSRLQWENLFLMIEDALATGGTLFYVGDKKQAIYRWRGGEVSLFDNIRERLRNYNIKEEQLTTNYRSQKEIVEFNNAVFSIENLERFLHQEFGNSNNLIYFSPRDRSEILEIFETSHQKPRPENKYGYVKMEKIEGEDGDERVQKIKNQLKDIILDVKSRNFDFSDIAILCRSNDEVEMLSGWLMEEGFSVQSEKTLDIRNNSIIKELISLLKFLNSPIDNLSFTAFVTGKIFQKATNMDWRELEQFLFGLTSISGDYGSEYIYRSFRNTYPDLWSQYLEEFFKSVGFLSTYELMLKILTKFRVFENFSQYQGFVMHLLELMKEKEEEFPSLEEFLEFYEHTEEEIFYLRFSESDAIRVMTIHKAKGLEFPVVIIPFLDMDITPGRSRERRGSSYVTFPYAHTLRLLRLDKKYVVLSPGIKDIYIQEYKQSFIDELDVIYVAFTRAQYELYAFLPYGGKKKNMVVNLIPSDFWEKGQRRIYTRRKKRPEDVIFINPCEYKDWPEFLKEERISIDTLKSRYDVKRGNILHSVLAFISDLSLEDKDKVLDEALTRVRFQYRDLPPAEYRREIENIVNHRDFKKFFYLDGAEVYQEREVVDSRGMTRRIDRLIITRDEIWVVEYKTGSPLPEYRMQVEEYMDIVKGMYPERKICGYIVYLDKGRVEEIYG